MQNLPVIITAAAFLALTAIAGFNSAPTAQAESAVAQTAAVERTVTFAVEKMTCAACPITVRKAMERIKGVKSVSVDFKTKTATAVFDPSVATPAQIGAASTNAGYPATPVS